MSGTEIIITLLASVALLLWGVRMVRTGITRAFGTELRNILRIYARNRLGAFGIGLLITAILQSSTATALLLSSFVSRGLIPLSIALATMLGADIGTAVAVQILSLDVKWLWSLLVAAGVTIFLSCNGEKAKGLGRISIGLGLMLLALIHIGMAGAPLRHSALFLSLLAGLGGEPALGFVVAILITWLAHSSLSIVLLIMSLAAAGALPGPLALALVLGANVGGAIAPLAALSGSPASARRVALGNLGARTVLALPAILFVAPTAQWLTVLTPDPGRLVVNFHIAFNLLVALAFLPLSEAIASLAIRVLPDAPTPAGDAKPRYLDFNVTDSPSDALACAMRETLNLGDRVADMLRRSLLVFERSDLRLLKEIEQADDGVDVLHESIKHYLVRVSRGELTEEESRRTAEILSFVTNLEHIGDIIDKNLMELALKKIKHRYAFSAEGHDEIRRLHAQVMDNFRLAFNVFATRDPAMARRLIAEKATIRNAEVAAIDNHYARLRELRPESIETSSIHLDVVRDLKRINSHLTAAAYPILETGAELYDSRLRVQPIAASPIAASANVTSVPYLAGKTEI